MSYGGKGEDSLCRLLKSCLPARANEPLDPVLELKPFRSHRMDFDRLGGRSTCAGVQGVLQTRPDSAGIITGPFRPHRVFKDSSQNHDVRTNPVPPPPDLYDKN